MNYRISIYREAGVWVGEAPELPGCACHATTQAEAFRAIRALIPQWVAAARAAGYPVPEPAEVSAEPVRPAGRARARPARARAHCPA